MSPKDWIADFACCLPAKYNNSPAWDISTHAEAIITDMISELPDDYTIDKGWAIHKSAIIEGGATLKPPVIIGPKCLIASNAYLRGGVYLGTDVIIGPSCEIKSSFFFSGSKAAHLSFVGDSIIGGNVNIEAGAMIANYRNEKTDKRIRINHNNEIIDTGVDKFGALIADGVRIGANAVIAPGALLGPDTIVKRLELIDQSAD